MRFRNLKIPSAGVLVNEKLSDYVVPNCSDIATTLVSHLWLAFFTMAIHRLGFVSVTFRAIYHTILTKNYKHLVINLYC